MRVFSRQGGLTAVAATMLLFGVWLWQSTTSHKLPLLIAEHLQANPPSTAYVPLENNWLEFPLSPGDTVVRVLTNGAVSHAAPLKDDTSWRYAFHYQFLDRRNNVLSEGEYHHRTRLTHFRDTSSKQAVTRNYFLGRAFVPTDGRMALIPIKAGTRPRRFRVRLSNMDPALREIMFRIYRQETFSERERAYMWQRFSKARKEMLARNSVYGADLLREAEKRNLIRFQWKAIGPMGLQSRHYALRKLYLRDDPVGARIAPQELPQGLYIDRFTHGVIPLPEGEWNVRLELKPLASTHPKAHDATVSLHWYGRTLDERWSTLIASHTREYRLKQTLKAGLLEVKSPRALVVRAWISDGEIQQAVTPEPMLLQAYHLDELAPAIFELDHVGKLSTPLRIDVRAIPVDGQAQTTAALRYQFINKHGQVISEGRLGVEAQPSHYDRLASLALAMRVCEPQKYYFNVPHEIAAVDLLGPPGLLVSAYTRPPDLVRRVRVPEDYHIVDRDPNRQPAWFILRPANHHQLQSKGRTLRLIVQRRPPKDDPQILAGQYEWESYQPLGDWRGRQLLIPRTNSLPIRDEIRAAVYRELSPSVPVSLMFKGVTGFRYVKPTLLYLRNSQQPMIVTAMVDGQMLYETKAAGKRGQLRLPVIAAGEHKLELRTSATARWYINHVDTLDSTSIRRLALLLESEGLEFPYEKRSADTEVITGQLHLSTPRPMQLRVQVDAVDQVSMGPFLGWTFKERLYDIRPQGITAIPVLNTEAEWVDGGQRFYLSLGADLPIGTYRIRIKPLADRKGYLSLYRLIPGQSPLRAFFRE